MGLPASGERIAVAGLVALTMFALAWAGIELSRETDRIAAVWLGNGAVLAILLRRPRQEWLVLLVAAASADVAAGVINGDAWLFAAPLAAANLIEIAIVAYLMVDRFGPADRFDSRPVINRFLLLAVSAPAVSAILAGAFLAVTTGAPLHRVVVS